MFLQWVICTVIFILLLLTVFLRLMFGPKSNLSRQTFAAVPPPGMMSLKENLNLWPSCLEAGTLPTELHCHLMSYADTNAHVVYRAHTKSNQTQARKSKAYFCSVFVLPVVFNAVRLKMPLEYMRVFLMVNLTAKLLPAALLIFASIYSLSHFTTNGRRAKCAASLARAKPQEFGVIPGLFNMSQETRLSPVQWTG